MIFAALEQWLAENPAGSHRIGQIAISARSGAYELRHHEDASRADVEALTGPLAARKLSLDDDAGVYRPLKTAPNLRHGWSLTLTNLAEVRLALDFFYPAMLGIFDAWQQGKLRAVSLRETLNRQTGMYALTKKITAAQADTMVGGFCADANCRKTILWELEPGVPVSTLPPEKFNPARERLPLLCHEICNLLVADARTVVKRAERSQQP